MKREEVLEKLHTQAKPLTEQYGIKALYLFGSVARDEADEQSDVDLFVEFFEPIGLFDFVALKLQLESILGRPVDLGTKRSLKQEVREMIKAETIRVT